MEKKPYLSIFMLETVGCLGFFSYTIFMLLGVSSQVVSTHFLQSGQVCIIANQPFPLLSPAPVTIILPLPFPPKASARNKYAGIHGIKN